jgi:XTP/dITP diphosphohydrolase
VNGSGAPHRATGRLVLLSTSPRVAPGLLSHDAWRVLDEGRVVAADGQHPLAPYADAAGARVETLATAGPADLARQLLDAATADPRRPVVFLLDPQGDDAFTRALSTLLIEGTGHPLPEVEVLPGSYDLPGARLLDLVATMDRLRSPGGCPWDAEQTHESLATYLVEETYETLEAIETGDRRHLREELGDLVLQVVFHSRIAAEHPDEPWSVDDVAGDIVDKLVRRHPHVFGTSTADTAADVEAGWERQKAAEKGRSSAVDGVPMALPALSLATKLVHRAEKNGVDVEPVEGDDLGARLMSLVVEARAAGLDAEAELRAAARRFADRVRAAESDLPPPAGHT